MIAYQMRENSLRRGKFLILGIWFWSFTLISAVQVLYGEPATVPDRLIVRFEAHLTPEDVKLVLSEAGMQPEKPLVRRLNIWQITWDTDHLGKNTALQRIYDIPEVLQVQQDYILSLRSDQGDSLQVIPDDPGFPNQWHFNNTGQSGGKPDADIDAPESWAFTTGGETRSGNEIVVAVIDDGCEMSHYDLEDNIWVNPGEIPDNGIDDDSSGYIDDINGWNTIQDNGIIPEVGSHGTKVSGLIGARGNNTAGLAGVNWAVKLMPLAVSDQSSQVMEAYGYVLDMKSAWLESGGEKGAFIVATNTSLGVDYADCNDSNYVMWNDLYTAMGKLGILSVAATANQNIDVDEVGDVPTGCTSPYLISVTNSDKYDQKVNEAAFGPASIDLSAPAELIYTTGIHSGTVAVWGTSFAAPQVTGSIALMHAAASESLTEFYEDYPDTAALLMKSMLLNTVDSLTSLDGITVSGGRLNVHKAVVASSVWDGYARTPLPPSTLTLFQNFPNPFNQITTINYGLDQQTRVQVRIYDLNGREIIDLEDSDQAPGWYEVSWDGKDNHGRQMATGIYFCQIETMDISKTIKITYLK